MTREETLSIIRRHAPELRTLGAEHIALFGSMSRDTAADASDVDVAVEFPDHIAGLARVGALVGVRERLTQILGRRVDVVESNPRSPRLREAIARDGVRAY